MCLATGRLADGVEMHESLCSDGTVRSSEMTDESRCSRAEGSPVFAPVDAARDRGTGASRQRRMTPLLALAVLAVAACSSAGSSPSPTIQPSVAASSPPSAAASAAPSSAPASAPSAAASPAGSQVACVDVGDLADQGDPVQNALQAIKPALAAKKVDDARAHAQTAITGQKSMADLVAPASPQGKLLFLKAADELTQAVAKFPDGTSLVDQAQTDLNDGFTAARTSACAS